MFTYSNLSIKPKLRSEVAHNLGQNVAIQRLKDSCEWAHSISDLRETWCGNRVEFTASIQKNLQQHFAVVNTTERFDETLALLKQTFAWKKEIASYARNVNTDNPKKFISKVF